MIGLGLRGNRLSGESVGHSSDFGCRALPQPAHVIGGRTSGWITTDSNNRLERRGVTPFVAFGVAIREIEVPRAPVITRRAIVDDVGAKETEERVVDAVLTLINDHPQVGGGGNRDVGEFLIFYNNSPC